MHPPIDQPIDIPPQLRLIDLATTVQRDHVRSEDALKLAHKRIGIVQPSCGMGFQPMSAT